MIFASDNGPWMNYGNHASSAGPLREAKGTIWEGGVRVACMIWWPGHSQPGRVCDKLVATIDLLPMIAAIADAPLPERHVDSVSILSLLASDPDAHPRDEYFYYYGDGLRGVRQGPWKLIFPHEYRLQSV